MSDKQDLAPGFKPLGFKPLQGEEILEIIYVES